ILAASFGVSVVLISPMAHAELAWDQKAAETAPKFSEAKATLEYSFSNAGQSPVRIISVNPACDCVTAKAERETAKLAAKEAATNNEKRATQLPEPARLSSRGQTTQPVGLIFAPG